jgi:membrane-associated phospholipid phosphatase
MFMRGLLPLLFVFFSFGGFAQGSGLGRSSDTAVADRYTPSAGSLVAGGVMVAYGFAALKWQPLVSFDHSVRSAVWTDNPHSRLPVDDYLQYAPALTVYVLNAARVRGKHGLRDGTIIYVMANAVLGAGVLGLKHVISAERPDGSGDDGFPSGHSATAFAAAEFLRQEYKDRSVWYGIAGYTAAVGTSFFRVYNDKHWFSEVVAGAGIGFLAAKAAYWVWPVVERKVFGKKRKKFVE